MKNLSLFSLCLLVAACLMVSRFYFASVCACGVAMLIFHGGSFNDLATQGTHGSAFGGRVKKKAQPFRSDRMCVIIGDALDFGVSANQETLTTMRLQMGLKSDMKEARNKDGDVVAVAFYNKTNDITIEGYGNFESNPGTALSLSDPPTTPVGGVYILEINIDEGQEDFVKSTIRAKAWENI